MKSRAFVIYRSENDALARSGRGQMLHGYEVDPAIGSHGGIVLDSVRVSETQNVKIPTGDPKMPYKQVKRRVFEEYDQWLPTECPRCGEPIAEPGVTKRCSVQACLMQLEYKSRHWYVCEPHEQDAKRLANIKTEWSYQEIHTEAELRFLKGEPEPAPEEFVDPMDRHHEAVKSLRGNMLEGYAAIAEEAKALVDLGAPKDELSHGYRSKQPELLAFIKKHAHLHEVVPLGIES